MSRGSTPERIDEARRAATRNHLMGEGVTEATADAWIAAWAAQAVADGLQRHDCPLIAGGWSGLATRRCTHRVCSRAEPQVSVAPAHRYDPIARCRNASTHIRYSAEHASTTLPWAAPGHAWISTGTPASFAVE